MTRPVSADSGDDEQLKEALAVLISSTRSQKRPLPITEIAHWLGIAVGKLGTQKAVGERIGLSAKMLRQFSAVEELTPKVRDLISSRKIDSVDAVAHLARLSEQDQLVIGKALAEKTIQTADVRGIAQLRQLAPDLAIDEILKRVFESKTKWEYVAEFVIRGGRTEKDLLKLFEPYIPGAEIIRLEIDGAIGRLVLSDKGKRSLKKAASDLGTSMSEVIPAIFQKGRS
jgi:hypothetical protein